MGYKLQKRNIWENPNNSCKTINYFNCVLVIASKHPAFFVAMQSNHSYWDTLKIKRKRKVINLQHNLQIESDPKQKGLHNFHNKIYQINVLYTLKIFMFRKAILGVTFDLCCMHPVQYLRVFPINVSECITWHPLCTLLCQRDRSASPKLVWSLVTGLCVQSNI